MPTVETATANIAPALIPMAVPLATISPSPRNPRRGDIAAITDSLRRFGQQKPIVVQRSTMHIVAGNHLYRAAEALGWDRIAANVVDMTDDQAKAFLIADNRTADLGAYDQDELAKLLGELTDAGQLWATGYDEEDVAELVARQEWKQAGGNPVISYTIIFDDEAQQKLWGVWLRDLRKRFPELETHAARIAAAIEPK